MREVICQFCQKKCRPDTGQSLSTYWRCDYHGDIVVKYMYPQENLKQNWHTLILVCKTDHAYFHACFFYDNPDLTYKFRIDRVVKLRNNQLDAKEIFHLDFHPEMTPENARAKIGKYVLFS